MGNGLWTQARRVLREPACASVYRALLQSLVMLRPTHNSTNQFRGVAKQPSYSLWRFPIHDATKQYANGFDDVGMWAAGAALATMPIGVFCTEPTSCLVSMDRSYFASGGSTFWRTSSI